MASYLTKHAPFVKRSFSLKAFSSTEHPLSVLYPKACVSPANSFHEAGSPGSQPSRRALAREFRVRNGAVRNTPWAWQVAHAESFAGASPCAPIAVQRAASGLATPAADRGTAMQHAEFARPRDARRAPSPAEPRDRLITHGNGTRTAMRLVKTRDKPDRKTPLFIARRKCYPCHRP